VVCHPFLELLPVQENLDMSTPSANSAIRLKKEPLPSKDPEKQLFTSFKQQCSAVFANTRTSFTGKFFPGLNQSTPVQTTVVAACNEFINDLNRGISAESITSRWFVDPDLKDCPAAYRIDLKEFNTSIPIGIEGTQFLIRNENGVFDWVFGDQTGKDRTDMSKFATKETGKNGKSHYVLNIYGLKKGKDIKFDNSTMLKPIIGIAERSDEEYSDEEPKGIDTLVPQTQASNDLGTFLYFHRFNSKIRT